MADLGKAIAALEYGIRAAECAGNGKNLGRSSIVMMHTDNLENILEVLKAQDEVIRALRKVGYPHDFQREEPWIVNYMYAITDVIKKAVSLRNGET